MKKFYLFLEQNLLKWGVALAIAFIALYPKLPSVHVSNTWVYIRLEDFLITGLVVIWSFLLLSKKIKFPFSIGFPIIIYLIAGLFSLIFSLIFIGPHLANFFPKVAMLSYVRRIEYMILFFIAFSTIKTEKDIKDYLKILFITVFCFVVYGFGQRWYINLWTMFPKFFEHFSFCFPSFQTGNEEFAKGIPLCLPFDARITSTFGGHYDLAAYLVVFIPVIFSAVFSFQRKVSKISILILTIASVMLLILTASRISFIAYILGACAMLIFAGKKKFIIPVIILSIFLLTLFSGSTAKRFLETIRFTSVVTNNQGQVVGVTSNSLPKDLQNKISKNPVIVEAPPPTQNLPVGSSFITLPSDNAVKTQVAVVQSSASQSKAKELKLANGGVEISTISGSFLIQKALVYDISFTTRFQSEWPNAWNAFLRDPILGSGFGSISLATDGDYHRLLGETGLVGAISFLLIFVFFGILTKLGVKKITSPVSRMYVYGISGGAIGLFLNATFIDVFEASKVAETFWIFVGITGGILALNLKERINYLYYLRKIFTSNIFVFIYLFVFMEIIFSGMVSNYFVAQDFTWMRWAASSNFHDISKYFLNADGFFYRPLVKVFIFALYAFFSFVSPEGYHIAIYFMHFLVSFGLFLIFSNIFKNKIIAFFGALLFICFPISSSNIFWISSMPIVVSSIFIVYGTYFWITFRKGKNRNDYILSIILWILALLSYEASILLPLIFLVVDIFLKKINKSLSKIIVYLPLVILVSAYLFVRSHLHAASLASSMEYYLYFLSILFACFLTFFMKSSLKYLPKKLSVYILSLFVLILAVISTIFLRNSYKEWLDAGKTTKTTLKLIHDSFPYAENNTRFIFINTPIRNKNAWIFSTGLADGIWFIYRDKSIKVFTVNSLDEAKAIMKKSKDPSMILEFDKNKNLKLIE